MSGFDLILLVVLVAFSAVRYFVGTDYGTYLSIYSAIEPSDVSGAYEKSPVEIGYTTVSIIARSLTSFPYAIFWVASIITIVPLYVAIKRSSRDLPFSVLIYMLLAFYVSPFNLVRQGIAIGLIFLAHTFYEKNRALYYVFSVLAGFFHYTAWFAAFVQWIVLRWRPSIRTVMYLVAGTLLAGAVPVVANATNPNLVSSILGAINPRYANYFEGSHSGIGTYAIIATRLALLYIAFLLLKRSGDGSLANWTEYGPWFTYAALGICFLVIGTQAINVGRIDYYFSVFLILLIPNLLKGVDTSKEISSDGFRSRVVELATSPSTVKIGFAVFGSIYFAVFVESFANLVPYQTYFWR